MSNHQLSQTTNPHQQSNIIVTQQSQNSHPSTNLTPPPSAPQSTLPPLSSQSHHPLPTYQSHQTTHQQPLPRFTNQQLQPNEHTIAHSTSSYHPFPSHTTSHITPPIAHQHYPDAIVTTDYHTSALNNNNIVNAVSSASSSSFYSNYSQNDVDSFRSDSPSPSVDRSVRSQSYNGSDGDILSSPPTTCHGTNLDLAGVDIDLRNALEDDDENFPYDDYQHFNQVRAANRLHHEQQQQKQAQQALLQQQQQQHGGLQTPAQIGLNQQPNVGSNSLQPLPPQGNFSHQQHQHQHQHNNHGTAQNGNGGGTNDMNVPGDPQHPQQSQFYTHQQQHQQHQQQTQRQKHGNELNRFNKGNTNNTDLGCGGTINNVPQHHSSAPYPVNYTLQTSKPSNQNPHQTQQDNLFSTNIPFQLTQHRQSSTQQRPFDVSTHNVNVSGNHNIFTSSSTKPSPSPSPHCIQSPHTTTTTTASCNKSSQPFNIRTPTGLNGQKMTPTTATTLFHTPSLPTSIPSTPFTQNTQQEQYQQYHQYQQQQQQQQQQSQQQPITSSFNKKFVSELNKIPFFEHPFLPTYQPTQLTNIIAASTLYHKALYINNANSNLTTASCQNPTIFYQSQDTSQGIGHFNSTITQNGGPKIGTPTMSSAMSITNVVNTGPAISIVQSHTSQYPQSIPGSQTTTINPTSYLTIDPNNPALNTTTNAQGTPSILGLLKSRSRCPPSQSTSTSTAPTSPNTAITMHSSTQSKMSTNNAINNANTPPSSSTSQINMNMMINSSSQNSHLGVQPCSTSTSSLDTTPLPIARTLTSSTTIPISLQAPINNNNAQNTQSFHNNSQLSQEPSCSQLPHQSSFQSTHASLHSDLHQSLSHSQSSTYSQNNNFNYNNNSNNSANAHQPSESPTTNTTIFSNQPPSRCPSINYTMTDMGDEIGHFSQSSQNSAQNGPHSQNSNRGQAGSIDEMKTYYRGELTDIEHNRMSSEDGQNQNIQQRITNEHKMAVNHDTTSTSILYSDIATTPITPTTFQSHLNTNTNTNQLHAAQNNHQMDLTPNHSNMTTIASNPFGAAAIFTASPNRSPNENNENSLSTHHFTTPPVPLASSHNSLSISSQQSASEFNTNVNTVMLDSIYDTPSPHQQNNQQQGQHCNSNDICPNIDNTYKNCSIHFNPASIPASRFNQAAVLLNQCVQCDQETSQDTYINSQNGQNNPNHLSTAPCDIIDPHFLIYNLLQFLPYASHHLKQQQQRQQERFFYQHNLSSPNVNQNTPNDPNLLPASLASHVDQSIPLLSIHDLSRPIRCLNTVQNILPADHPLAIAQTSLRTNKQQTAFDQFYGFRSPTSAGNNNTNMNINGTFNNNNSNINVPTDATATMGQNYQNDLCLSTTSYTQGSTTSYAQGNINVNSDGTILKEENYPHHLQFSKIDSQMPMVTVYDIIIVEKPLLQIIREYFYNIADILYAFLQLAAIDYSLYTPITLTTNLTPYLLLSPLTLKLDNPTIMSYADHLTPYHIQPSQLPKLHATHPIVTYFNAKHAEKRDLYLQQQFSSCMTLYTHINTNSATNNNNNFSSAAATISSLLPLLPVMSFAAPTQFPPLVIFNELVLMILEQQQLQLRDIALQQTLLGNHSSSLPISPYLTFYTPPPPTATTTTTQAAACHNQSVVVVDESTAMDGGHYDSISTTPTQTTNVMTTLMTKAPSELGQQRNTSIQCQPPSSKLFKRVIQLLQHDYCHYFSQFSHFNMNNAFLIKNSPVASNAVNNNSSQDLPSMLSNSSFSSSIPSQQMPPHTYRVLSPQDFSSILSLTRRHVPLKQFIAVLAAKELHKIEAYLYYGISTPLQAPFITHLQPQLYYNWQQQASNLPLTSLDTTATQENSFDPNTHMAHNNNNNMMMITNTAAPTNTGGSGLTMHTSSTSITSPSNKQINSNDGCINLNINVQTSPLQSNTDQINGSNNVPSNNNIFDSYTPSPNDRTILDSVVSMNDIDTTSCNEHRGMLGSTTSAIFSSSNQLNQPVHVGIGPSHYPLPTSSIISSTQSPNSQMHNVHNGNEQTLHSNIHTKPALSLHNTTPMNPTSLQSPQNLANYNPNQNQPTYRSFSSALSIDLTTTNSICNDHVINNNGPTGSNDQNDATCSNNHTNIECSCLECMLYTDVIPLPPSRALERIIEKRLQVDSIYSENGSADGKKRVPMSLIQLMQHPRSMRCARGGKGDNPRDMAGPRDSREGGKEMEKTSGRTSQPAIPGSNKIKLYHASFLSLEQLIELHANIAPQNNTNVAANVAVNGMTSHNNGHNGVNNNTIVHNTAHNGSSTGTLPLLSSHVVHNTTSNNNLANNSNNIQNNHINTSGGANNPSIIADTSSQHGSAISVLRHSSSFTSLVDQTLAHFQILPQSTTLNFPTALLLSTTSASIQKCSNQLAFHEQQQSSLNFMLQYNFNPSNDLQFMLTQSEHYITAATTHYDRLIVLLAVIQSISKPLSTSHQLVQQQMQNQLQANQTVLPAQLLSPTSPNANGQTNGLTGTNSLPNVNTTASTTGEILFGQTSSHAALSLSTFSNSHSTSNPANSQTSNTGYLAFSQSLSRSFSTSQQQQQQQQHQDHRLKYQCIPPLYNEQVHLLLILIQFGYHPVLLNPPPPPPPSLSISSSVHYAYQRTIFDLHQMINPYQNTFLHYTFQRPGLSLHFTQFLYYLLGPIQFNIKNNQNLLPIHYYVKLGLLSTDDRCEVLQFLLSCGIADINAPIALPHSQYYPTCCSVASSGAYLFSPELKNHPQSPHPHPNQQSPHPITIPQQFQQHSQHHTSSNSMNPESIHITPSTYQKENINGSTPLSHHNTSSSLHQSPANHSSTTLLMHSPSAQHQSFQFPLSQQNQSNNGQTEPPFSSFPIPSLNKTPSIVFSTGSIHNSFTTIANNHVLVSPYHHQHLTPHQQHLSQNMPHHYVPSITSAHGYSTSSTTTSSIPVIANTSRNIPNNHINTMNQNNDNNYIATFTIPSTNHIATNPSSNNAMVHTTVENNAMLMSSTTGSVITTSMTQHTPHSANYNNFTNNNNMTHNNNVSSMSDDCSLTLFHLAAKYNHRINPKAISLLLQYGCDKTIRDHNGFTPTDYLTDPSLHRTVL